MKNGDLNPRNWRMQIKNNKRVQLPTATIKVLQLMGVSIGNQPHWVGNEGKSSDGCGIDGLASDNTGGPGDSIAQVVVAPPAETQQQTDSTPLTKQQVADITTTNAPIAAETQPT